MKSGFQKFELNVLKRIIRQHWYLEVIWNRDVGLFADYQQSIVGDEDLSRLPEHDQIVNPPAAGSLANTKSTSSHPAATLFVCL